MLASNFVSTYRNAADDADIVISWDKRTEDANVSIYNDHTFVEDPSLPLHSITLKSTEAKRTSQFYGTRRNSFTLRKESLVPTPVNPDGTLTPRLFKVDASTPAGVPKEDKIEFLNEFRAVINSDIFEKFYLELQS